jgi:hypothetical protein
MRQGDLRVIAALLGGVVKPVVRCLLAKALHCDGDGRVTQGWWWRTPQTLGTV